MPYVVGDIVQIKDVQSIEGQEILNVYYYRVSEVLVELTSDNIMAQFILRVITDMLDLQANSLEHVQLEIANLTDGLTVGSVGVGLSGAETGTLLATNQLAYAIRLNRSTALTRNGAKRIAGVPESSVVGNSLSAPALTELEDLADRIGTALVVSEGVIEQGTLRPVIVGRTPTGALDLTKINLISSATALNRVTTQNSRKPF